MIRAFLFNVGQVGAILVNAALADRREVARLRGLLRAAQDDLADVEQRCNLLAHRVEEAESDVRRLHAANGAKERRVWRAQAWAARWKELAHHLRFRAMALRGDRDSAWEQCNILGCERDEARQQRDGLRLDLSMAEARANAAECERDTARRAITTVERELAAEREKVALYQRGEAATRAQAGES